MWVCVPCGGALKAVLECLNLQTSRDRCLHVVRRLIGVVMRHTSLMDGHAWRTLRAVLALWAVHIPTTSLFLWVFPSGTRGISDGRGTSSRLGPWRFGRHWLWWPSSCHISCLFSPTRCCSSAVLAVCLSVCHKLELCWNEWADQDRFCISASLDLYPNSLITQWRMCLKVRVFPSGTAIENLDCKNLATARRPLPSAINKRRSHCMASGFVYTTRWAVGRRAGPSASAETCRLVLGADKKFRGKPPGPPTSACHALSADGPHMVLISHTEADSPPVCR